MSVNGKNIHEILVIGVFVDSNLNFTIRIFTFGVTNDLQTCKKYAKPAKLINRKSANLPNSH